MDVLVIVPQSFGLRAWIGEGDPAGVPWSGLEWDYYLGLLRPKCEPGDRVYVAYNGVLRGYAPLVRIGQSFNHRGNRVYSLVRHNNAVAVTIPQYIPPFRGFRYRFWDRNIEVPFPDWHDPDACIGFIHPKRRSA